MVMWTGKNLPPLGKDTYHNPSERSKAVFLKRNNPIVESATDSGDSGTERLSGDPMSVGGGLDSPAPPNLAELSGRRRPAGTASVRLCVCVCARHLLNNVPPLVDMPGDTPATLLTTA